MALNILRSHNTGAINLIRLLSYLNPEAVMTDFLVVGTKGINRDLKALVQDRPGFATALRELDKWSLIKWDQEHKTIAIHRMVQSVVRDHIHYSDDVSTFATVIEMSRQVFPSRSTNETRVLYEKYQVLELLLRYPVIPSEEYGMLQARVGSFLCEDGKYREGEKLLQESVNIFTKLKHFSSALGPLQQLAKSYRVQGRIADYNEFQLSITDMKHRVRVQQSQARAAACIVCVIF